MANQSHFHTHLRRLPPVASPPPNQMQTHVKNIIGQIHAWRNENTTCLRCSSPENVRRLFSFLRLFFFFVKLLMPPRLRKEFPRKKAMIDILCLAVRKKPYVCMSQSLYVGHITGCNVLFYFFLNFFVCFSWHASPSIDEGIRVVYVHWVEKAKTTYYGILVPFSFVNF